MPYRSLNAEKIETTIETLQKRIEERFPGRGLAKLCTELLTIAREDRKRLSWVSRPNRWIQAGVTSAIALGAAGIIWIAASLQSLSVSNEAFDVLQGIEAVLNIVALAGAAIWFLLNVESNMRRERVLADLHELRSIAHVVDMHQLTKDPTTLMTSYKETASSDPHHMSEFELMRYLDYCSEMLALTAKLAALYMQDVRDPVIIDTVNEIEDLTGNLSRKIWQKIMILRQPAPATAKAP
ncbi:MAG: hypothetical protein Q8R02_13085 [Hyphomonadaceae bacterium]|nr:hypothetical protein [Hyphomonadaceae bacterium]